MYDEDKINDSLEFVEQIRIYKECDPMHITNMSTYKTINSKKSLYETALSSEEKKKYPIESTEKVVRSFTGDIIYVVVCVFVSVFLAYCITHFVAHHTKVDGNSMNSTLSNNDYLLIEKISYYLHDPERFDIVVFPFSDDVNYIKRVIGLPGEKVQIIDGKVYINDEQLYDDIYGKDPIIDAGLAASPIYLGEDEFFVLGDNRNSSFDSRKEAVGLIKRDRISGKAIFRFWPLNEWGGI